MVALPDGYEHHAGPELHTAVRAGQHAAVEAMGLTRLEKLRSLLEGGRSKGRGRICELPLAAGDAREPLVLKQVLHGGLYGRLNPEGHRGPERLLRELAITERARRRGVPVPQIVYLAWTERRPCRLFLGTIRVADSRNLGELLRGEPPGQHRRSSLAAAARAVSKMHDAGLLHADLNLSNLMVAGKAGQPQGWVLDLDRSGFPARLEDSHRAANLARLLRSLEKTGEVAAGVGLAERARFLRDYCGGSGNRYRELRNLIRRRSRWLSLHRLAWRLGWR
jgi:tRNA A-37 threonylcarbamoyl transferase component Bud32